MQTPRPRLAGSAGTRVIETSSCCYLSLGNYSAFSALRTASISR